MRPKQAIELIEKFPSATVLVFGDVMLDSDVECSALGVANEAPIPLLEVLHETPRLGGAANVAKNLARLGVRTHLIGATGPDHPAEIMKGLLAEAGISFHPILSDRLTTRKSRIRSGSHYYLRIDEEDSSTLADESLTTLIAMLESWTVDVSTVIVSDYDKGMISATSAAAIESLARRRHVKIIADLKPRNVAYWHDLALITPNLEEAKILYKLRSRTERDAPDNSELARNLSETLGCDVVLKLADQGLLTFSRAGQTSQWTALCQSPRNVAGAGDTVLATLGAALATNGAGLEDCAYLANVAAAVAISQPGPHAVSSGELAQYLSSVPQDDAALVGDDKTI
jgi:D-beta-D-heptose 7-phosphate kinase/D-beta-D-heptose 1-phosphate adenosyltransferase